MRFALPLTASQVHQMQATCDPEHQQTKQRRGISNQRGMPLRQSSSAASICLRCNSANLPVVGLEPSFCCTTVMENTVCDLDDTSFIAVLAVVRNAAPSFSTFSTWAGLVVCGGQDQATLRSGNHFRGNFSRQPHGMHTSM
jgi:hypothetical protein